MTRPLIAGVAFAVLSALVDAFGLLGLLYWQARRWPKIEENFGPRRNLPVFLALFGVIFGLHVAEMCLWAGFYFWRGCLPELGTSVYFSATSYLAAGYGDVMLPRPWRLLGALESLTGLLLLGCSAAFFSTPSTACSRSRSAAGNGTELRVYDSALIARTKLTRGSYV